MTSLESINEKLRVAAENLDQAATAIRDLPLEPPKLHIRGIGEALANVFEIQHEIYRLRPDLQPAFLREDPPEPDGDLTPEQIHLVEQLTDDEIKTIDNTLFSNTSDKWRKVARVVGTTMLDLPCRVEGIPDIYYSQRVRKLVENDLLESQGDLSCMRYSEVRRPDGNETTSASKSPAKGAGWDRANSALPFMQNVMCKQELVNLGVSHDRCA